MKIEWRFQKGFGFFCEELDSKIALPLLIQQLYKPGLHTEDVEQAAWLIKPRTFSLHTSEISYASLTDIRQNRNDYFFNYLISSSVDIPDLCCDWLKDQQKIQNFCRICFLADWRMKVQKEEVLGCIVSCVLHSLMLMLTVS